jgi:hypothetical protein
MTERWRPEAKCTELAAEMTRQAEPNDLLAFMHGDAFPIADWVGPARGMVAESRLAAVRRDEFLEPIPHSCFCVTTAGFWGGLETDWFRGPTWNYRGKVVSDAGAKLWKALERRGIDWHPILRTNSVNLHPIWFAVYGDLIYHQGAGFRVPMSRADAADLRHLPIPLRNFAGVRRRITNTIRSRRMYRRIRDDERFWLTLTGGES